MGYQTLIYEAGPVARVILDRPDKRNAQSWTLLAEMEDAFNAAVRDPACRIIVLSGNGSSFSAGHDLDSQDQRTDVEEQTRGRDGFARSAQLNDIYVDSHLRWRNLHKPTLAMVHGYCVYGGWMIAAAMDFIFAADDALFIPTYGDYFTTCWDVGARKAKELLYENSFLTAQQAMDWGFVNRVYPAATLEQATLKYAARVAESNPFSLRTVKFSINQTLDTMGFTTSVRSVSPGFLNRRASRREGEPAATPTPPAAAVAATGTRMRSGVARALEYLRQDREESGGS
jgi:enoyl-CoA hydratase